VKRATKKKAQPTVAFHTARQYDLKGMGGWIGSKTRKTLRSHRKKKKKLWKAGEARADKEGVQKNL